MIQLKQKDPIEYQLKLSQFKNQIQQQENTHAQATNTVKCPRCGSTNITAGQRGYSLLTGFVGSGRTVNRCANCGHKWKPWDETYISRPEDRRSRPSEAYEIFWYFVRISQPPPEYLRKSIWRSRTQGNLLGGWVLQFTGACISDIYPFFDLSAVLFSGLSITLFCISVFSVMFFQAISGVVWYVLSRAVETTVCIPIRFSEPFALVTDHVSCSIPQLSLRDTVSCQPLARYIRKSHFPCFIYRVGITIFTQKNLCLMHHGFCHDDTFSGLRLPPIFDMFRIKIRGAVFPMSSIKSKNISIQSYSMMIWPYVEGPVNYDV